MKIKITNYGTIEASEPLLNLFGIILSEASDLNKIKGHNEISIRYNEYSDEIYKQLKEGGFYDN